MPTNYTMPTNITGFASLGEYANVVTNNLFGIMILVAIAVMIFILLNIRFTNRDSVAVAGFITALLGILMRFINWINDLTLYSVIALGFFCIMYFMFTKEN